MMEEVYTDLDDVPIAVRIDPSKLSFDVAALKHHSMRVQPSDDHEWTMHNVEEVEEQDDGTVLARLSKPLEDA